MKHFKDDVNQEKNILAVITAGAEVNGPTTISLFLIIIQKNLWSMQLFLTLFVFPVVVEF